MQWELLQRKDGVVELYFEDYSHGKDVTFRFNANSTIDRRHDDDDTGETTWVRLDIPIGEALKIEHDTFHQGRRDLDTPEI